MLVITHSITCLKNKERHYPTRGYDATLIVTDDGREFMKAPKSLPGSDNKRSATSLLKLRFLSESMDYVISPD